MESIESYFIWQFKELTVLDLETNPRFFFKFKWAKMATLFEFKFSRQN